MSGQSRAEGKGNWRRERNFGSSGRPLTVSGQTSVQLVLRRNSDRYQARSCPLLRPERRDEQIAGRRSPTCAGTSASGPTSSAEPLRPARQPPFDVRPVPLRDDDSSFRCRRRTARGNSFRAQLRKPEGSLFEIVPDIDELMAGNSPSTTCRKASIDERREGGGAADKADQTPPRRHLTNWLRYL
jgi:hypothetical protein